MTVIRGKICTVNGHQIRVLTHISLQIELGIAVPSFCHPGLDEMGKQSGRVIADRSLQIRIGLIVIISVKHSGIVCNLRNCTGKYCLRSRRCVYRKQRSG